MSTRSISEGDAAIPSSRMRAASPAIAAQARAWTSPLDGQLEARFNQQFPAQGERFSRLSSLCVQGEAEAWLMNREAGGIKFGRAVKPGKEAGRFSLAVVRMKDIAGQHQVHTTGEIGRDHAGERFPTFDGEPEGW